MPAMVFDGEIGGGHLSASVGDDGVSTLTFTASEDVITVTLEPSGTVSLAFNGLPATEAEEGFVLPDGRTVARYSREQRCGGSDKALTDAHGNILFKEARWLGAMCAGIKLKTFDDRALTDCLEEYSLDGGFMVIRRKITLPGGSVINTEERKPLPAEE